MSRKSCRFKQTDLARAIRAARSAGVDNPVIEVDRNGCIRIDCTSKKPLEQPEDITEKI